MADQVLETGVRAFLAPGQNARMSDYIAERWVGRTNRARDAREPRKRLMDRGLAAGPATIRGCPLPPSPTTTSSPPPPPTPPAPPPPAWGAPRGGGPPPPTPRPPGAGAGSFMGLATSVDYATEVTLQPLERFPLDAAILFSDILTVPDAMGLGLSFAEGEGPRLAKVVRDEAAVAALAVPDMARLRYVFDAVASIRRALNGRVPLIGFSGSPWTLACYMVEGRGSADYRLVKGLMYSRPDLMHRILAINADTVAAYLNAQIDAGPQAVMVFDSWGGVLADGALQAFSLAYTARPPACWRNCSAPGWMAAMCRASSSPRAARRGCKTCSRWTAGCWAWTGRPTWPARGPWSAAPWAARARRCRATSPPMCCWPRRRASCSRCSRCSTALARPTPTAAPPGLRISSTWATASASSRRRRMWPHWSRPCTATRGRSARAERRAMAPARPRPGRHARSAGNTAAGCPLARPCPSAAKPPCPCQDAPAPRRPQARGPRSEARPAATMPAAARQRPSLPIVILPAPCLPPRPPPAASMWHCTPRCTPRCIATPAAC